MISSDQSAAPLLLTGPYRQYYLLILDLLSLYTTLSTSLRLSIETILLIRILIGAY